VPVAVYHGRPVTSSLRSVSGPMTWILLALFNQLTMCCCFLEIFFQALIGSGSWTRQPS